MFKYIILKVLIIICWFQCNGQSPNIEWEHSYGHNGGGQGPTNIIQTTDNGFLIPGNIGHTGSFPAGYKGGDADCWIVKTDSTGIFLWEKFIGGTDEEVTYFTNKTSDGGFILTGWTNSNDLDISGNHQYFDTLTNSWRNSVDGLVVKLDSLCNIQWQRCYGGSNMDYVTSIAETPEGGYICCGFTNSDDGDVSGLHGQISGMSTNPDAWVIKIDSIGNIQWQRCYGGSNDDAAYCIKLLANGYAVLASAQSSDFDVTNHIGSIDYWFITLDSIGNIVWSNCYGGTNYDDAFDFIINPDNSFLLSGYTASTSLPDYKGGDYDGFLVKIDSLGNLIWQKCYGGSDTDGIWNIILNQDGTVLASGFSWSNDGDVSGGYPPNFQDIWIFNISTSGNFIWKKKFGSLDIDIGSFATATSDGSYAIAAVSCGVGGDVSYNYQPFSLGHYWAFKLSTISLNVMSNEQRDNTLLYPNPSFGIFQLDFGGTYVKNLTIQVVNTMGEVVHIENHSPFSELNKIQIEIPSLSSGFYILNISTEEKLLTKRLIIE